MTTSAAVATRTLTLSTDSFDRINTFNISLPTKRNPEDRMTGCSLHRDYRVAGDGVLWAMNAGSIISSSYSPAEIAERNRLNAEAPVKNGDIVEVEGKLYRMRVLGRYSDCAILDAI